MKIGVALPTSGTVSRQDTLRLAQHIEDLGFDSLWVSDHVAIPRFAVGPGGLEAPFLEPMATCAWLLGVTERIRVGTDIVVAAYRHPLLLRAMAATTGLLSDGRLILGMGVGYLGGEFEALGADVTRRGQIANEVLATLRSGDPDLVQVDYPVPLWVGGNADAAIERAALLGDGWHPLFPDPEDYGPARRRITQLRDGAGLTTPFTFSYSCGICQLVDQAPREWPTLEMPPKLHADFGYQPPFPFHADGRPWFIGTSEDVLADFDALEVAGVDHVALRFMPFEIDQQLMKWGALLADRL